MQLHLPTLDIDECASSPCGGGGTCTEGEGFYTCECTDAWTGDDCTEGKLHEDQIVYLINKKSLKLQYMFLPQIKDTGMNSKYLGSFNELNIFCKTVLRCVTPCSHDI